MLDALHLICPVNDYNGRAFQEQRASCRRPSAACDGVVIDVELIARARVPALCARTHGRIHILNLSIDVHHESAKCDGEKEPIPTAWRKKLFTSKWHC
jgi:hypothetical protein